MTIYIEAVFLTNALLDYLFFLSAATLAALPVNRGRIVLGALLGGAYSVLVLIPRYSFLGTGLFPFLIWASMSLIVFWIRWKGWVLFFLLCASFSGILLAIRNGVTATSNIVLFLCGGFFYFVIRFLFAHGGYLCRMLKPTIIRIDDTVIRTTTLCDTGNDLRDRNDRPVLILSMDMLPQSIKKEWMKSSSVCDQCKVLQKLFPTHSVELLNYTTIGGTGLIPAVQCSEVVIDGRTYFDTCMAVSMQHFSRDYQSLWGCVEEEKHEVFKCNGHISQKIHKPAKCLLHRGE